MSAMLQRLRDEQAKHEAGSELQKLLCWAEVHIADITERLLELEDEISEANEKIKQRATAMNEVRGLLEASVEYLRKEDFSFSPAEFAKDYAPWRNIMAAYGFNQDGTPSKQRKKKAV